jgi:hypothetical protein
VWRREPNTGCILSLAKHIAGALRRIHKSQSHLWLVKICQTNNLWLVKIRKFAKQQLGFVKTLLLVLQPLSKARTAATHRKHEKTAVGIFENRALKYSSTKQRFDLENAE